MQTKQHFITYVSIFESLVYPTRPAHPSKCSDSIPPDPTHTSGQWSCNSASDQPNRTTLQLWPDQPFGGPYQRMAGACFLPSLYFPPLSFFLLPILCSPPFRTIRIAE